VVLVPVIFKNLSIIGKTTGLTFLREKLTDLGYNVITVPEAATLIFNGGGFNTAG
jgi:hypothetical protein